MRLDLSCFQARVGYWHRLVFGDHRIPLRILQKFEEEAREFSRDPSPEEAADVVICLCAYADRAGFDLAEAVETKFREVRARKNQRERDAARGIG